MYVGTQPSRNLISKIEEKTDAPAKLQMIITYPHIQLTWVTPGRQPFSKKARLRKNEIKPAETCPQKRAAAAEAGGRMMSFSAGRGTSRPWNRRRR